MNKKAFKYFDWTNFFLIILLALIGLLFVFSATYKPEIPFSTYFKKQAIGILLGIGLYLIAGMIDYRTWMRMGYFLFIASLGLLIFTLIRGTAMMGGQRWINLFFFKFQPSELIKLFFPAFFAYYIHTHHTTGPVTFRHFIPIIFMLFTSTLLVLKQPDLGTALIVLFSGFMLLWLAGVDKKFFIMGALIVAVSTPILWTSLKDYQKKRITTFLGQGASNKERYQIEQSRITIGSGKWLGKGLLSGTQNRLLFLPQSRNDFIFAVLCEELGFLGALFIILLYIALFVRIFGKIVTIKQLSVQIFAVGLTVHVALSALINLAMVVGLLPVVGIPLPFMSYGMTNLWVTFVSLGWFQSISQSIYSSE
jgi:rod shape determining protein RodA